MKYQENKVFNLKLAAKTIDGLLIQPGETFSFWQLVRHADRFMPYKDGLTVINGNLTTEQGGGLCQLSNDLFWLFLHSPLTILERHGHRIKDFPEPERDGVKGIDATVAEGWLDLKVRNDTNITYQIALDFDDVCLNSALYADVPQESYFLIRNGACVYGTEGGRLRERVTVCRQELSTNSQALMRENILYINQCYLGYALEQPQQIAFGMGG